MGVEAGCKEIEFRSRLQRAGMLSHGAKRQGVEIGCKKAWVLRQVAKRQGI
jgi:hypothetical protein